MDKELKTQLAKDLIWALKFLRTKSSGGVRVTSDDKMVVWQESFMDSLSKLGVEVDREEYWKMKEGKQSARKERK